MLTELEHNIASDRLERELMNNIKAALESEISYETICSIMTWKWTLLEELTEYAKKYRTLSNVTMHKVS